MPSSHRRPSRYLADLANFLALFRSIMFLLFSCFGQDQGRSLRYNWQSQACTDHTGDDYVARPPRPPPPPPRGPTATASPAPVPRSVAGVASRGGARWPLPLCVLRSFRYFRVVALSFVVSLARRPRCFFVAVCCVLCAVQLLLGCCLLAAPGPGCWCLIIRLHCRSVLYVLCALRSASSAKRHVQCYCLV